MSNLRTLAAFIFAFAILATVPSIRSQMRQPAEMPLALRDAILFTVVLYEVIMIWGSLSRPFDRCPYKHVFKRIFATFDVFFGWETSLHGDLFDFLFIHSFEEGLTCDEPFVNTRLFELIQDIVSLGKQ